MDSDADANANANADADSSGDSDSNSDNSYCMDSFTEAMWALVGLSSFAGADNNGSRVDMMKVTESGSSTAGGRLFKYDEQGSSSSFSSRATDPVRLGSIYRSQLSLLMGHAGKSKSKIEGSMSL